MIKKIICQLWNQRRMNGWIFIELVIVSFFLWTVIDPIYILTADKLIASGYDAHNRYVVKIGNYESSNGNYQAEMNTDSICKESYNRIVRVVRDLPEMKDFSIASSASFPNSGSWNGTQIYMIRRISRMINIYIHNIMNFICKTVVTCFALMA